MTVELAAELPEPSPLEQRARALEDVAAMHVDAVTKLAALDEQHAADRAELAANVEQLARDVEQARTALEETAAMVAPRFHVDFVAPS